MHEYLAYLEDAFLVRTVPIATRSVRRRMVNPRKAYPVDPGLIPVFVQSTQPETGHALETVVMLELERRGYAVTYVRTQDGAEVDFLARAVGEPSMLIQVCADARDGATMAREIRSLVSAQEDHRDAQLVLITLDSSPPPREVPRGVTWMPAARWLLERGGVA